MRPRAPFIWKPFLQRIAFGPVALGFCLILTGSGILLTAWHFAASSGHGDLEPGNFNRYEYYQHRGVLTWADPPTGENPITSLIAPFNMWYLGTAALLSGLILPLALPFARRRTQSLLTLAAAAWLLLLFVIYSLAALPAFLRYRS